MNAVTTLLLGASRAAARGDEDTWFNNPVIERKVLKQSACLLFRPAVLTLRQPREVCRPPLETPSWETATALTFTLPTP